MQKGSVVKSVEGCHMRRGLNMIKRFVFQVSITICFLAILTACRGVDITKLSADKLREVKEGMSEREVVALLGRPERVKSQCLDKADGGQVKSLYYSIDDGRKWAIVINEHDQTIGSGETISVKGSGGGGNGALGEFQKAFSGKK